MKEWEFYLDPAATLAPLWPLLEHMNAEEHDEREQPLVLDAVVSERGREWRQRARDVVVAARPRHDPADGTARSNE